MPGVEILGLGHYAPERVVTSADLEQRLGQEPGWIERRTGIRERRWAADGEKLSDMAIAAGEMALASGGIERNQVGLTLLATSTPDHLLPPTAPLVAHRLGLSKSGGIDLAGACAGFLYALTLADAFVRVHQAPVLVVAANILSRRINMNETASAILFADAAGAVLLGPSERPQAGVLAAELASEGAHYDLIKIAAGGSARPFHPDLDEDDVKMTLSNGRAVFQRAVAMMTQTSRAVMAKAGVESSDIRHVVPHQANSRIIEAVRGQLGLSHDQVLSTVAGFGNSSAATIPFTMSFMTGSRDFQNGERVLLCAAGAGLTGGSVVLGL
ncbi:MAG: beta-ketoacyl-ACP synthase III [Alphaproteobacteria bacterium]|nr:beta-ketoacyl-ACP synthase III [Alphaproteobacteria bacterium]